MRKKFVAIVLAGLMALSPVSLVGCNTGTDNSTDKTQEDNSANTTPTTPSTTPSETPTTPTTPSETETVSQLPLTVEYGIADQSYLYGVCYLIEQREYWGSPFVAETDIPVDVQLISNLGAKTVRQWMHCTTLMKDKDTMDEDACAKMHLTLKECSDRGIVSIGMNHHNFNNGINSVGKIARRLTKGSEYITWLSDYYTTWYNLVKEFPEVSYWEIDNELNNPDFMFNAHDKSLFSAEEMAAIATDMLYYATRAIHDANPEAQSVMGGLTEPLGLGKSDSTHPSNVWFLQQIYDNIYSGAFGYFYDTENEEDASLDPDDYFDIACWHPYVWNKTALDEDYFVQENNKVYQVILDNEKKHKKVFLSEVGFTDLSRGEEIATESVKRMFHAVSTRMPYVETVDVFKLYDLMPSETESDGDRYGFFYDPNPNHTYYKIDDSSAWNTTSEVCTPGAAKLLAYVFQELAGGSGSLELMKNYYAK